MDGKKTYKAVIVTPRPAGKLFQEVMAIIRGYVHSSFPKLTIQVTQATWNTCPKCFAEKELLSKEN